jgi:hypothetical protein
MSKLVDGLSPNGKLMVIAVTVDPMTARPPSSSPEVARFRVGGGTPAILSNFAE